MDGNEDKNGDGRVDIDETDPLNSDTDESGLLDGPRGFQRRRYS